MTAVQDAAQSSPNVLYRAMTSSGTEVGLDWGLGTRCDEELVVASPGAGLLVVDWVADTESETGGRYSLPGERVDLPLRLQDAWLVAADYVGGVFLVESDLGNKQPGRVLMYSPKEYGHWLKTLLGKIGNKPVVLLARQQPLSQEALDAVDKGLRENLTSGIAPKLYTATRAVTIRNAVDLGVEQGVDDRAGAGAHAFALVRMPDDPRGIDWLRPASNAAAEGGPRKLEAPLQSDIDRVFSALTEALAQTGDGRPAEPVAKNVTDEFLAALNAPAAGQPEGVASPEGSGLVPATVDGADGWVRRSGAVPGWAALRVLADQAREQSARQTSGVSEVDQVVQSSGTWSRNETAPALRMALALKQSLAGGAAEPRPVEELEAGGSGVRALLGGRDRWATVKSAGQVERLLVGEGDGAQRSNAAGLYAVVVWEPAAQDGKDHGMVWHAHQVDGEVRWLALGEDARWLGKEDLARLGTGRAQALFVAADGRKIDVYGQAGAAKAGTVSGRVVPPASGWLDPESEKYDAQLASEFHAKVVSEATTLKVPAKDLPSREVQRQLYAELYPGDPLSPGYRDKYPAAEPENRTLDQRAGLVADRYKKALLPGAGKDSRRKSSGRVQRGRGSGRDRTESYASNASYTSDLAYGSFASTAGERTASTGSSLAFGEGVYPTTAAEHAFSGTVGLVTFETDVDGPTMRVLANNFRRYVAAHMQDELAAAGPFTVRFGRTQGWGVGEWLPDRRTLMLSSRQARSVSEQRLLGTTVFEMLNASSESERLDIENSVLERAGVIDQLAARNGITPAEQFGRMMEQIEHRNIQKHKQIMAAAGLAGTDADVYRNVPDDFETHYSTQKGTITGHAETYEYRYSYLMVRAESAAWNAVQWNTAPGASAYDMNDMLAALPSDGDPLDPQRRDSVLSPTEQPQSPWTGNFDQPRTDSYSFAPIGPIAEEEHEGQTVSEEDASTVYGPESSEQFVDPDESVPPSYVPPQEDVKGKGRARGRGGRRWAPDAVRGRAANVPSVSGVVPRVVADPVGVEEIRGLVSGSSPRLVELRVADVVEVLTGAKRLPGGGWVPVGEVPPVVVSSYGDAGLETGGLRAAGRRPVVRGVESTVRFDHRVLEAPGGRRVHYLGKRVFLDAQDAGAEAARAGYGADLKVAFEAMVNRGFATASGDQLFVSLTFTDDPAGADQVVGLTSEPVGVVTPELLSTGTPVGEAVHEAGHWFGLPDEYVERPTRQQDGTLTLPAGRRSAAYGGVYSDDSFMANPSGRADGSPGTEWKQRHTDTAVENAEQAFPQASSVPYSVDAEFSLSDTAAKQFAGKVIEQLSAPRSWGAGPLQTLVTKDRSPHVAAQLEKLVHDGAGDLALGRDASFDLGKGFALVLSGSLDPGSGAYTKQLDEPERAKLIASLAERRSDPGDRSTDQALWEQQKAAKEQARWYRYTFPFGLRAELKTPGGGQHLLLATGDDRVTVHVPDPGDMAVQGRQPVAAGAADAELPCPPVPETAPTLAVPLDNEVPGLKALFEHASTVAEERTGKGLAGLANRLRSRGGKEVQALQVADSALSKAEAEVVAEIGKRFQAEIAKQAAQGLSSEEVRLVLRVTGTEPKDLITGYRLGGLLAQALDHRITVQTEGGGQIDVCP